MKQNNAENKRSLNGFWFTQALLIGPSIAGFRYGQPIAQASPMWRSVSVLYQRRILVSSEERNTHVNKQSSQFPVLAYRYQLMQISDRTSQTMQCSYRQVMLNERTILHTMDSEHDNLFCKFCQISLASKNIRKYVIIEASEAVSEGGKFCLYSRNACKPASSISE